MEKKRNIALDILTQSFEDNGSVNYVVGTRESQIRQLMQYSYTNCIKRGDVVFHESNQAIMLFKYSDASGFFMRIMFEELMLALLGIGLGRIRKVIRRESYISRNRCKEPHLYLWFIGTYPEFQGQGYGSELMKKLLALSNQTGKTVCLETSNPKNLAFYHRFGFHIYHESNPEELGYKLWFMKTRDEKKF